MPLVGMRSGRPSPEEYRTGRAGEAAPVAVASRGSGVGDGWVEWGVWRCEMGRVCIATPSSLTRNPLSGTTA